MLKLKNISKTYLSGEASVEALKEINLEFRKSEFVSILGQSGCGKTTLLNIIGGLDAYTDGDLIINNRSTKDYKDRDWDVYRNKRIGFVFQSYNLIPHQSVLKNVELALTLSGVSKAERRQRAKEALTKVGLSDQLNKRPSQMSGGQMQRVAIARALVNNPEIILADEPTGALDSETSVQVMEILKEISKDRLIIMVTHNPTLAEKYSSRIIRLLDGKVVSDSNPFEEQEKETKPEKNRKKPLSFLTATSLSLNNLMTKKARTFLTSFAGSIGIIGIALILSVSQGVQSYIDSVEEDTLSSYPITLEAESADYTSLLNTLMGATEENVNHEKDAVYGNSMMFDFMNAVSTMNKNKNNLPAFKKYLETEGNGVSKYLNGVSYSYDFQMNIYSKDPSGEVVKADINDLMTALYGEGFTQMGSASMAGMSTSQLNIFEELLPALDGSPINEVLLEQYEVVYGSWPKEYNEIVIVVNENNELADLTLYSLGLKNNSEMQEAMNKYFAGEEIETKEEKWSYEEILNKEYKLVLPSDRFKYNETTGEYQDLSETKTGLELIYENGITLKVSGIIRPSEDATSAMLRGSIGYTNLLTKKAIEESHNNLMIKAQLGDKTVDIFTGLPFKTDDYKEPTNEEKAAAIKEYLLGLSESEKATYYTEIMATPDDEFVENSVNSALKSKSRKELETYMIGMVASSGEVDEATVKEYLSEMSDEDFMTFVRSRYREVVIKQYAEGVKAQLKNYSAAQLSYQLNGLLPTLSEEKLADIYDNYMPPTHSESTLEKNLQTLGYIDLESPSAINLYSNSFEAKDLVADAIEDYNNTVEEEDRIRYTDYVGLLMSSVTTIINAISYVLIAFVAISLIVSSIMIGIITYISVLERTKEIGILRSIGASKTDISRVFNAETLIVGLVSGAIGIGATLLFNAIINIILFALTEIPNLKAVLPFGAAVILIIISMSLTFIAGLVPSRIAAKKNPVEALRTE